MHTLFKWVIVAILAGMASGQQFFCSIGATDETNNFNWCLVWARGHSAAGDIQWKASKCLIPADTIVGDNGTICTQCTQYGATDCNQLRYGSMPVTWAPIDLCESDITGVLECLQAFGVTSVDQTGPNDVPTTPAAGTGSRESDSSQHRNDANSASQAYTTYVTTPRATNILADTGVNISGRKLASAVAHIKHNRALKQTPASQGLDHIPTGSDIMDALGRTVSDTSQPNPRDSLLTDDMRDASDRNASTVVTPPGSGSNVKPPDDTEGTTVPPPVDGTQCLPITGIEGIRPTDPIYMKGCSCCQPCSQALTVVDAEGRNAHDVCVCERQETRYLIPNVSCPVGSQKKECNCPVGTRRIECTEPAVIDPEYQYLC